MTAKIDTADAARAIIIRAIKDVGRDQIINAIGDWNNTIDNDIDSDGDVWVSDPQTGHWVNDDRLIELAELLLTT